MRVIVRIIGVMATTTAAEASGDTTLAGRVATRVRMLMAAQRRTNGELAEVLNLSERAAQRRRLGEHPFSLAELEAVGEWLGVEPMSLLSGRGFAEAVAS